MKINVEDTDEDYALFGRLVLIWGHVEACLGTLLLRMIWPPNLLPNKGLPVPFSQRVQLAVKGFHTLPRYASLADSALPVLCSLEQLHNKRTVIVHGLYQGNVEFGLYTFGLVKSSKDGSITIETHMYSKDDIRLDRKDWHRETRNDAHRKSSWLFAPLRSPAMT